MWSLWVAHVWCWLKWSSILLWMYALLSSLLLLLMHSHLLLIWRMSIFAHLLILMSWLCLYSPIIKGIDSSTCTTLDFSCCSSHTFRLGSDHALCSLINVIEWLLDSSMWDTHKLLLLIFISYLLLLVDNMLLVKWIFKSLWHFWSNHIWVLWCVCSHFVCGTHTIIALSYIINILISLLHMLSSIINFLRSFWCNIHCICRWLSLLMLRFLHNLSKFILLLSIFKLLISDLVGVITVVLTNNRGVTILAWHLFMLCLLWDLLLRGLTYLFHINLRFLHVTT